MAGRFAICIAFAVVGHSTASACGYGIYRWQGPQGLETVLQQFDDVQARLDSAPTAEERAALRDHLERLTAAVDEVAGQRHATVSRLYWYTDLEQAKIAAAESGKPILSLRMLGKLTDEFSCANSRYFRTTLYANKEISDFLREKFVLHWQSVRPVPTVTIDFGNGRKLERTVTGNSAHYVLAPDGRPLDVLPGLYSPQEFLRWLNRTQALSADYLAATDAGERESVLTAYHRDRLAALDTAELRREDVRLDDASVALIRRENPTAFEAGRISVAKSVAEDPILRLVGRFEASIAADTVRNESQLHRKIHEWYLVGEVTGDYDALNERVYSDLFLTPSSDPWLGLAPPDVYTALDNGGLVGESR
jgi:hypothetical protein